MMMMMMMMMIFFFRPFGQCAEVLTPQTVEQYFLPIVVSIVLYILILHDNFIARFLAGVKENISSGKL